MAKTNERAAQARADAKAKAQAAAQARERRTTVTIITVSLLVIAVFVGVVYFIANSSKAPAIADVHRPATADDTGGLLIGAANEGATRVDVYFDFLCPYCAVFEHGNGEMLLAKSEAGDVALYYHPLGFLDGYSNGTKYSTRTANAAAVVADRAPQALPGFVVALFANQPAEGGAGLTDAQIADIAVGAGVPSDVAATFGDGEFTDWVAAATQQASIDGISSTPSLMIDREILPQSAEVPWMQEGVLERYLLSVVGG